MARQGMENQSKPERYVYLAGYATDIRSARRALGNFQERGLADDESQAFAQTDWHEKPEMVAESIKNSHTTAGHSLSDLSIGGVLEAWPKHKLYVINPSTSKRARSLISGGRDVLFDTASKAVSSRNHRKLLVSGVYETVRNPFRTVRIGLLGVEYDSIGRLSKEYDKLPVQHAPDVTIITSNGERMFEYDEVFSARVIMAGFKHVRVEGCHNVPYINPDVILDVLEGHKV